MKHTKHFGSSDLNKLFQQDKQPFIVMSAPMATSYKVTIDDVFTDTYQFDELVDVLDNAGPEDCVQIRLNTPGGALHSIIPLISAMKNTEAFTHIHVTSDTASAGTLLMMVADSVFINEYTSLMLHNASYSYGGHAGNMEAHVNFSTKALKKVMGDLYKDFLTEREIEKLQDGLELYLTADEAHERFKLREKIRSDEGDAILKEIEKVIEDKEVTDDIYKSLTNEEENMEFLKDITKQKDNTKNKKKNK